MPDEMLQDFIMIPGLTEENIEEYFREHAVNYFKHCSHAHEEFRIGDWLYTVTIDYCCEPEPICKVENISWCKVRKE